jgi:hypothetical protein
MNAGRNAPALDDEWSVANLSKPVEALVCRLRRMIRGRNPGILARFPVPDHFHGFRAGAGALKGLCFRGGLLQKLKTDSGSALTG